MQDQATAYADVDVIVDGALEQSLVFYDECLLTDFIDQVRQDAESDGYPTEVYILRHEHGLYVEECSCVQYVTDGRPSYSWNMS